MAIGPVQLIVLGFPHPEFHGEVIAELERLRASDTVRVIDALAVHKDDAGDIEVVHLSNLSRDEAIELGSKVGALIGLGIAGEEGAEAGALAGAEAGAEGLHPLGDAEGWDVLEDIPNGSAAALILLEHHWAVGLRDAVMRAGGFRLSDGFISPLDLVASVWSPPRKPPNCTPWKPPAPRPDSSGHTIPEHTTRAPPPSAGTSPDPSRLRLRHQKRGIDPARFRVAAPRRCAGQSPAPRRDQGRRSATSPAAPAVDHPPHSREHHQEPGQADEHADRRCAVRGDDPPTSPPPRAAHPRHPRRRWPGGSGG